MYMSNVKPFEIDFETAYKNQHLYKTMYIIEMVKTDKTVIAIGATARKSCDGILKKINDSKIVQNRISDSGVSLNQNYKKEKGVLILDDGTIFRFGPTLLQFASENKK